MEITCVRIGKPYFKLKDCGSDKADERSHDTKKMRRFVGK